MSWYIAALKKYATFKDRAQRAEYWYFMLLNLLIYVVTIIIDRAIGMQGRNDGAGFIPLFYSIAMIIPSTAVGVRRMHDIDRSGWWVLMSAIPLLGSLGFIYLAAQEGDPDANKYGPNPKAYERIESNVNA